jgi:hypothetical protein
MKAPAAGTAFEIGLYQVLARLVPERVLVPIAVDPERAWIVLPDGGTSLGERLDGPELADALAEALGHYAELQRTLGDSVEELRGVGVSDMRPAVMLDRFDEVLDVTGAALAASRMEGGADIHRRATALRPTVASWCEHLSASRVPPSLDHNDLHPWNILGEPRPPTGDTRFYDWGDSVVAHPFASLLTPLGFVQRLLDVTLDDPRLLATRDRYLTAYRDYGDDEDLAATVETACRVAKVARVLTWDRALQAARRNGDEIADEWHDAPLEVLASLLEDSYLGEV